MRTAVGKARAGDRAQSDHDEAGEPPGQDDVDKAAAMQDGGPQHRAEHEAAGKVQPVKSVGRQKTATDQHGELQRRIERAERAGRQRRLRQSEQRKPPE